MDKAIKAWADEFLKYMREINNKNDTRNRFLPKNKR